MKSRHVSELLAEFFRRNGLKRSMRRAEAVLLWPRVVGADVARFSSARALRDGVLFVDVSDSETAMHLSLQRSRFLKVFHDTYRVNDVKEIRFQVGRVGESSRASDDGTVQTPLVEADPGKREELARRLDTLGLPSEVGSVVQQAGERLLALTARRRAEGWQACPTCGALHDGPIRPITQREEALATAGRRDPEVELDRLLCGACRRYAQEGRVRAAAMRLRLDPMLSTPNLADDERAVAVLLACQQLDILLRELMPAAVSDPRLLPELEQVTRCRVGLSLNLPAADVKAEDVQRFDPRLARLLRGVFTAGDQGA